MPNKELYWLTFLPYFNKMELTSTISSCHNTNTQGGVMKKRNFITFLLIICCFCAIGLNHSDKILAAPSGQWQDLGGGWRFRVDPPHTENSNAKWHVHVENTKTGVKGSEGVDGTASHGDHMNNIPKKVKDKIKNHPEYKKGKDKQKKLNEATKQIKQKGLKIDWKHVGDVVLAIGIVIGCTATFFFQGDDIAAWMNLLRALGC